MKSSSIGFIIQNNFESYDEIVSAFQLYRNAVERLGLSNIEFKYQTKYKVGDIITDTDNIDDFVEDTLNEVLLFWGMQIYIHSPEGHYASIFVKRKSVIFPHNTTISGDNLDHLNMLKKSIQNLEICIAEASKMIPIGNFISTAASTGTEKNYKEKKESVSQEELFEEIAANLCNDLNALIEAAITRPQFIRKSGDSLLLADIKTIDMLLASYKFTAEKYLEEDGSVTLSLNEIDLAENAATETEAKNALGYAILDYAKDYFSDYKNWSKAKNKERNIPYVLKALICNDAAKIGKSILSCEENATKQKMADLQEEQVSLDTLFKDYKGDYKCKEVDFSESVGKELW